MFVAETSEAFSFGGRIECSPWQSMHEGASRLPFAVSDCPWVERWYSA